MVFIVVVEIIFSSNQAFIHAKPKIIIGSRMFIINGDNEVFVTGLLFQYIITTMRFGVDIFLVSEL